jgi:hypothetical protein
VLLRLMDATVQNVCASLVSLAVAGHCTNLGTCLQYACWKAIASASVCYVSNVHCISCVPHACVWGRLWRARVESSQCPWCLFVCRLAWLMVKAPGE